MLVVFLLRAITVLILNKARLKIISEGVDTERIKGGLEFMSVELKGRLTAMLYFVSHIKYITRLLFKPAGCTIVRSGPLAV